MRIDPMPVIHASDPRVDDFMNLTDMDLRQRLEPERGLFMAEGHLVIERCAASGMEILAVLTSERWLDRLSSALSDLDTPVYVAADDVLREITGYRVHRGALAAVRRPVRASVAEVLEASGDVVVLEDLVDPTNVGLAIRSAIVQGIRGIVLSPRCADPLYRKAVKASMGSVLHSQWARSDEWTATLSELASKRRLIALTPRGDSDLEATLEDVTGTQIALAFGSEGPGLSDSILDAAWRRCAIPMASDHDSLNVAAAVAVASYARSRSIRP
jgi:tRNA G18 (ribose-2'-O)-methylase SpoU